MRDLFPGFYKRTEEELSKLWEEGIFVFDTNMLLNVYRYTQKTRNRYFEILDLLKKRNQIWIPHQVAYEYQENRIDVIQGQLDAYAEVSNILQTTWQKLESSLEPYKRKHGFIDADKLAEELTSAIKNAKATVTQGRENDKREYEALKKDDTLLATLERIFQGNIGNPYTRSRLEELYKQAQLRIELRIPPGWEDEGKNSIKAYGDIILWFQLVDYARWQKKPIIFVTDDGKKDWWVRDSKGKPVKPLPALVQEMFVEANVLLHMNQGYEFLQEAEHFLKLEEKPEVIEEAKEVTQQNIVKNAYQTPLIVSAFRAELAIYEWLNLQYPQSEIIQGTHEAPDFVVLEPSGTRIGFEVKFFVKLHGRMIERLLPIINRFTRGLLNINSLNIVIATNNEEDAIKTIEIIERLISLPENVSIILGYLDQDNHFHFVARLPND